MRWSPRPIPGHIHVLAVVGFVFALWIGGLGEPSTVFLPFIVVVAIYVVHQAFRAEGDAVQRLAAKSPRTQRRNRPGVYPEHTSLPKCVAIGTGTTVAFVLIGGAVALVLVPLLFIDPGSTESITRLEVAETLGAGSGTALSGAVAGFTYWLLQGLRRTAVGWIVLCAAVSCSAFLVIGFGESLGVRLMSANLTAATSTPTGRLDIAGLALLAALVGIPVGLHGWFAQKAGRSFFDLEYSLGKRSGGD